MSERLSAALIAWFDLTPSEMRRFMDLVHTDEGDNDATQDGMSESAGYIHLQTGPVGMPCRFCGRQ